MKGRRPGPLGVGNDHPHAPDEHHSGGHHRAPLGLGSGPKGRGKGRHRDPASAIHLAEGQVVSVGHERYRIRRAPAAGAPASREHVLSAAETQKVLAHAAHGHPELAQLRHLLEHERSLVLVRLEAPTMGTKPAAVAEAAAAAASPPPKAPKPVKEGWIEIEVTDAHGQPRTGDAYKLQLPDGRTLEGKVGPGGLISVHGIDPGSAKLTFTELDGKAWS